MKDNQNNEKKGELIAKIEALAKRLRIKIKIPADASISDLVKILHRLKQMQEQNLSYPR